MQTMQSRPLRLAAIHDLSGFGRCSLSVILPVISTMGIQVCSVPTAVLSAHTGGLGEVVLRDLTDYINAALEHYKKLQIDFECIYTGYLGSVEQIDLCLKYFDEYKNALHVVDPVMGDHGKPYKMCTQDMQNRMHELVQKADIITPNLTEVSILLGEDYINDTLSTSRAKSLLVRLCELGPKYTVITGVFMTDGKLANIGYDKSRSTFWRINCEYVQISYPGTGDIFASILCAGMLKGDSLPIAMDRASKFVELAIKTTYSYGTDPRYGVMLEKCLYWLLGENILGDYKPL